MTFVPFDHKIRVETGLNSTLLCLCVLAIVSAFHAAIENLDANLVTEIVY